MAYIKLKVTSKVLKQSEAAENQEKIAITEVSGVLAEPISEANKRSSVSLTIARLLRLNIGDTHAIWKAHNTHHRVEFDSLFNFLAKHPDEEFKFYYSVF
jgi:hypothetical protein